MILFSRLIIRQIALITIMIGVICFFTLVLGGILPPAPRIVYMASPNINPSWDLFMLDMRTGATIRLTNTPRINERYPAWSSDGQVIAYHATTPTSDLYDIHLIPANNPLQFTRPFIGDSNMGVFAIAYDKAMPAWSPDDAYLGFHAKTENGRYGLFMGRADGTELRMLVNPIQDDILHFAWSPNGKQITFSVASETSERIYLLTLPDKLQPAGSNRANMQLLVENGIFGTWSPDGTKLVYMGGTPDRRRLWIYDFITNTSTQLTLGNAPFVDVMPTWSSDGEWIVFSSSRAQGRGHELYKIRPDGTDLHRLTFGFGNAQAPNWTN